MWDENGNYTVLFGTFSLTTGSPNKNETTNLYQQRTNPTPSFYIKLINMKNRKERKNIKRIWLQKLKAVIVSPFVLTASLAVPLAVRLLHAGGATVVIQGFACEIGSAVSVKGRQLSASHSAALSCLKIG
jgi:hypothetical protein